MRILKNLLQNSTMVIMVIIVSIIPLVIWPHGTDYFYYPKILAIYMLLIITLVIGILSYRKARTGLKYSGVLIPLAFFMIFVILSTAFSPYVKQAVIGKEMRCEGLLTYISYFMIFVFSYKCIKKPGDIKYIIVPLLISSSLISIYAILQYMGVDPLPRDSIRVSWKMVSFSTLGNPNFLGSYLSILFPASLFMYLWSTDKVRTGLLFIASLLSYSALMCTQARSAWVGGAFSILIASIVFYKVLLRNYKKLLLILICMAIATYALNAAHNGAITSRLGSMIQDYKTVTGRSDSSKDISTAGSQRIFIWSRTLEYIFDRPVLGYGPDTLDRVFIMSPEEAVLHFGSENIYVDKAHNEYLQILVTLGFPALASYLAFIFMIVFKSLRSIQLGYYSKYTVCLLCGAGAYMIQAFFNISVVSVAPVYWCVLGLLSGVNQYNKNGYINREPNL